MPDSNTPELTLAATSSRANLRTLMNINPRPSLRPAIDAHCKACVYDELARGTWREQVADCGGASCALYQVRAVPRDCVASGVIDRARVADISAKLARTAQAEDAGTP